MTIEERFWQGEFGNEYTSRNVNYVESNYQLFHNIFEKERLDIEGEYWGRMNEYLYNIKSIIEFGAGSGQNILALQKIFPNLIKGVAAVEINKNALTELHNIPVEIRPYIYPVSILDWNQPASKYDLVLSKGLLIHIHPDNIQKAYEVLYNASNKYILICEYYNPAPIEVNYRGNTAKLWKRDFAGEMLDKYPDLSLIDYGFAYHRDKYYQDDLNWFLLSK